MEPGNAAAPRTRGALIRRERVPHGQSRGLRGGFFTQPAEALVSTAGGASAAARPRPADRPAGLSLGRLAWLQAAHRRTSTACLGLCLAIAVVLPALLPLLDGYALERAVADVATSDGGFTVQQKVADVDQFGSFQREVAARVDGSTAGAL